MDQTLPVAASSALYRFLRPGYSSVSCSSNDVRFQGSSDDLDSRVALDLVLAWEVRRGWFWNRLTIHVRGDAVHEIGGLSAAGAEAIQSFLAAYAAQNAAVLEPRLIGLNDELQSHLDGSIYLRHSRARPLHGTLAPLLKAADRDLVRSRLSRQAFTALSQLRKLRTEKQFETRRDKANAAFVVSQRPVIRKAAQTVTSSPLTDEQADAIATDEDATLVLAGAGTGKTSVIVAKIAHLVENERVPPEEILALAYNVNAAKEIRARLKGAAGHAHVRTFHGFALGVLADGGRKPGIAPFAEDRTKLDRVLEDILSELSRCSPHRDSLFSFLAYFGESYRSPFDFETLEEYRRYVRSCEPRALSGDLMKSLEEVEIANYLSENAVPFEYEAPYRVPTATSRYRQYQPDFYLPENDVYIEHFALDERGRAPPHFRGYEEGVRWKRSIHEQHGTRLIETYSWERRQGILRKRLEEKLRAEGIELRRIPRERLLKGLRERRVSSLTRLLGTFLQHVKNSAISSDELRRRAEKDLESVRCRTFLDVFDAVLELYERKLQAAGQVDFEDLINKAAQRFRDGVRAPYRYVLVDELQDISAGRMSLIAALRGNGPAYFLVGDDWQSIYRFAGGDVRLVRGCGEFLGHVRERELTATFRYREGILEPTTAFVRRNPEQTQRTLRSRSRAPDSGLTVVACREQREGIASALRDIRKRESRHERAGAVAERDGDSCFVLVLGRYNASRQDIPNDSVRLEFSTVHRAKGRESEYAIVLDLRDDWRGFPSQVQDDPLLDLVLPPTLGSRLPHAEERRLLYVAMTRARRGVYLIANRRWPSAFVEEIIRHHSDVRRIGVFAKDAAPPCPRCLGHLVASDSGKNLVCRNRPFCEMRAHPCDRCDAGFWLRTGDAAHCTNRECAARPRPCPKCKFGVLVPRNGPYGPFHGCTEYWAEPPCTFKKRIAPRTRAKP